MEFARNQSECRARRIQFLCLLAVLLIALVFFLLEDRASGLAYLLAERWMALPAMAFLGASLCREGDHRWQLYAGLAMIALFFLIQVLHLVLESEAKQIGTFVCAYGLCFPFAAATRDEKAQVGLKWMAGLFLTVGTVLTVYTMLLLLNAVPEYLKNYVYWDGSRLFAMGHPNICATLLMVSLLFCAGFALTSRELLVKIGLAVLMLAQFFALSLTNGRTTIILTCLLLGGIVFCVIRGRGWKRFALAVLAAVVVMAAAFGTSRALYGWNQNRLTRQVEQSQTAAAAEPEPVEPEAVEPVFLESEVVEPEVVEPEAAEPKAAEAMVSEQYQGTLANDFKTLNGRTEIWRTALLGLNDNPRLKFIGTEYVDMILTRYAPGTIYHTHNSWLEALYRMGLPGLAAALVITVLAVWSALVVLWRNTDLWKSCIALLTLCLLGCAMLEPYLFVADVSYFYLDFLFLMCLGYLCLWRKEKDA